MKVLLKRFHLNGHTTEFHPLKVRTTLNVSMTDPGSERVKRYVTAVLFIMLYKVVLTFESEDEILKCDYSNESY